MYRATTNIEARMKLEKNLGFSIVEVMVALALLGVGAVGLMKITETSNKAAKQVEQKMEGNSILNQAELMLLNESACRYTLKRVVFPAIGASVLLTDGIRDPNDNEVMARNKYYANKFVQIGDISLTNNNVGPDASGTAKIKIELKNLDLTTQTYVSKPPKEIIIQLARNADGTVKQCYSHLDNAVESARKMACWDLGGVYDPNGAGGVNCTGIKFVGKSPSGEGPPGATGAAGTAGTAGAKGAAGTTLEIVGAGMEAVEPPAPGVPGTCFFTLGEHGQDQPCWQQGGSSGPTACVKKCGGVAEDYYVTFITSHSGNMCGYSTYRCDARLQVAYLIIKVDDRYYKMTGKALGPKEWPPEGAPVLTAQQALEPSCFPKVIDGNKLPLSPVGTVTTMICTKPCAAAGTQFQFLSVAKQYTCSPGPTWTSAPINTGLASSSYSTSAECEAARGPHCDP